MESKKPTTEHNIPANAEFTAPPHVADIARRLYSIVSKHRWAALAGAVIIMIAGSAGTYFAPRKYSAVSKLLVHPTNPIVLDKVKDVQEEGWLRGPSGLTQFYNTQQDIISGKAVAEIVVDRLGLDHDESFMGRMTSEETGLPLDATELRRRATEKVRGSLKLRQGTDSQVFTVTVTDREPQRAADIANGIASAYRDFVLSLREALTRSTSEWLDGQVQVQRDLLTQSEEAIQNFTQTHAIQGMGISEWRNLSAERLAELQGRLFDARRLRQERESELDAFLRWTESGRAPADFPSFGLDPEVTSLRQLIGELDRFIAIQAERYGAEWPALKESRAKRTVLAVQLEETVARAIGALESRVAEARQVEGGALANMDSVSTEASRQGELEVEYNRLRRDAETNAALYEQVLRRAKETQLSRSLQASNVNVLEVAEAPQKPSFPRVPINILATLIAALGIGALTAFLMEAGDSTVQDPAELDAFFHIWPLGVLPAFGQGTDGGKVDSGSSQSAAAECLRAVRTNVLFQSTRRPLRRIVVTSASPRDGKTTLCANLAATMALAGHRVLLIDTDMRRPRVHKSFELENQVGLADVLAGAASLDEAIQTSHIKGLQVLACGSLPSSPAEMLSGAAFRNLLDSMQSSYDYILLDSPPVLVVTDALILSQYCDGVILVLRIGQTERRNFGDALRALGGIHANILGVVCNGVDLSRRGSYGYGYSYEGYRQYGSDNDAATPRAVAVGGKPNA